MKKKLAIYGAGGFGLETAMLAEQINSVSKQWEIAGFFDDGISEGAIVNGYRVLGGMDRLNGWSGELYLVLAVGTPLVRRSIFRGISNEKILFPTLIHPSVILGNPKYLSIGEGSIICAGNIITTNISIGRHVILNMACTVGHESAIGDFSAFMPTCNISGEVTIGEATYWGTGAKVINRVTVGDEAVIGAGAVVIRDIPAGVTAVGVPAKVVAHQKEAAGTG